MIWVAATLIAATAQTARNAAQAGLTREIGTLPATAVRFVFGLPFSLVALGLASLVVEVPMADAAVLGWATLGALSQIAATALMLLTMRSQAFGVATALMKTEPVTLALIGAVVLAEPLGPGRLGAIALATLGVVLASGASWGNIAWRPAATGILSGALFGLSAVGFRGALLALPEGGYMIRALTVLSITLAIQTAVMITWLILQDRQGLRGMARHRAVSLGAGALGAFASLFWFIGFALTPAANVRTLALVEVVLAQLVSGRVFRQAVRPRQLAGMALITLGVGWLLAVTAGRV